MKVVSGIIAAALAVAVTYGLAARGAADPARTNAARQAALADRADFWGVHLERKVSRPDSFWRLVLSRDQFDVTRRSGTEPAWSGKYARSHGEGTYRCIDCGNLLFDSSTKFESGTGWPSFWRPASGDSVRTRIDRSDGMLRTEVLCARCGAHLGHVFDDGPPPTHLRYCMNSAALDFEAKTR